MIKKQKNQTIKKSENISQLEMDRILVLEKIQIGIREAEDGKFLTLEQAEQRLSKWLK
jgi:predicted transcriptional regulator